MARNRARLLATIVGASTLALAGCLPYPVAPPAPAPAPVEEPLPSAPVTTTAPAEPTTAPPPAPSSQLPDELPLTESIPEGYQSGWATDLISNSRFSPTEANDFPVGPTIEVIDSSTSCAIFAYNGEAPFGTDDVATTTALLDVAVEAFPGATDAGELWFASRSANGVAVEFGLRTTTENGVWAARSYGTIGSAQVVQVLCANVADEMSVLTDIANNNLGVDFLEI